MTVMFLLSPCFKYFERRKSCGNKTSWELPVMIEMLQLSQFSNHNNYFVFFTSLNIEVVPLLSLLFNLFLESLKTALSLIYRLFFWVMVINCKTFGHLTVFLHNIGIQQMPTQLLMWKAKSHWPFFADWCDFFCHFESSKLSKWNWRKIPIPKQICAYYIFR